MSTKERKKVIRTLRQEGREAFLAGRNIHSNPHMGMNRFQWDIGWSAGQSEATSAKHSPDDGAAPGIPRTAE